MRWQARVIRNRDGLVVWAGDFEHDDIERAEQEAKAVMADSGWEEGVFDVEFLSQEGQTPEQVEREEARKQAAVDVVRRRNEKKQKPEAGHFPAPDKHS